MAYHSQKEIEDMDTLEIRHELKALVKSSQQHTELLEKLSEISIRREERENRQEEINATQSDINTRQTEVNNKLFNEISNIKLDRAREENGRNFIQKYYPFIMVGCVVGGAIVMYVLPRLFV